MCKVIETTTFNKVFSDVENTDSELYKDLADNTLAEKIYKLRINSKLSQRDFANTVGIGYSSVCKYETGYKASNRNLIKICNYFHLDVDYFNIKD